MSKHGKLLSMELTRNNIALILDVTVQRVSQLANELRLTPTPRKGKAAVYSMSQLRKMQGRNTKPGPNEHTQRRTEQI